MTAEPDEAQAEDKQRRILHLLEPGDRVLAVYNTSRIQGVETTRRWPVPLLSKPL